MSTAAKPALSAREEAHMWQGPSGRLEVLLTSPVEEACGVAILCHPHPLYGGDMRNKVVTTLVKCFDHAGLHTVRFNFRGIGKSEGVYGEGEGECEDAKSIAEQARVHWPMLPWALAGFSFGGMVAARVADVLAPQQLVCVSPSVEHFDLSDLKHFESDLVVLQGEADEVVPAPLVKAWAEAVESPCTLLMLPDCSHFFHGQLMVLHDRLLPHIERVFHVA